jgi:hypothetical protein
MVFLIQNTQNRDALAVHLKLDELIHGMETADDAVIRAEDETLEELEALKRKYEALSREHDALTSQLQQKKTGRATSPSASSYGALNWSCCRSAGSFQPTPATGRVIVGGAASSLATIPCAGHLIAQRSQPFCCRGQLVLDTVDLHPFLTFPRDLPDGLQRLVEARDRVVDEAERIRGPGHKGVLSAPAPEVDRPVASPPAAARTQMWSGRRCWSR